MSEAKEYMEELLTSKQVEPNEALGKAINYMLKRWDKFTQFLRIAGATPQHIDKALLARKRGYRDYAERYSAEAAICIDYFKYDQVTEEEAEIWCNPSAKDAAERLEKIIKILRLDPSIYKVQKANEILNKSGITLGLFKKQRLSQEEMKTLTECIASHCAELVGFGLLRELVELENNAKTNPKEYNQVAKEVQTLHQALTEKMKFFEQPKAANFPKFHQDCLESIKAVEEGAAKTHRL